MARFCSRCGAQVQGTPKFCINCGQTLAQAEQTVQPPQPNIPPPRQNPRPQAQQPYAPAPAAPKSKTPFIIAGAVVALAALAVVLIVTDAFGLAGEKDGGRVTATVSNTPAPTDNLTPAVTDTPEPTTAPPAALWVDESKPNPDALFRLGMTRDALAGAIALTELAVAEDGRDYIDAPPMFFGLKDGVVSCIIWDVAETGVEVPTANGFTARSTVFDLERAMSRPLAACAEDGSIMYLYQSGGQYTEVYMDWKQPYEIHGFRVDSTAEDLHASPDYDDYDAIQDHIAGRGSAANGEGLILLHNTTESARNELALGDTPQIILAENRTTGYVWFLKLSGDDIVEILSDEYIMDPADADLDGVGGTRVITMTIVGRGEAFIEMVCKRDDDILQTASYQIDVSGDESE